MKPITVVGILGVIGLATACQFPLVNSPPPQGVEVRLTISEPSLAGRKAAPRLLLETATALTVTVTSAGRQVDSRNLSLAGRRAVSVTFPLVPLKPYRIEAQARDAAGVLRFSGTTTVTPDSVQSAPLLLLPVFAESDKTGWPVLVPSPELQPAGSNLLQGLTLAAGTSTSYLVDFGTTATAFSLVPPASDLEVYVQDAATGKALSVDPSTLSIAKTDAVSRVWLTYYAPTSAQQQPTLGRFTIPAKSLELEGPLALAPLSSSTVKVKKVSPVNATEGVASDFDWSSSEPKVLAVKVNSEGALVATAGADNGKATITARSKLGGGSAGLEVTVRPTTSVTFSLRTGQSVVATDSGTAEVYNSPTGDANDTSHLLSVAFTDLDLIELWYDVDDGFSPGHQVYPDDDVTGVVIDATGGAPGIHTLRVQAKFSDGHFAGLLVPFQVLQRGAVEGPFQLSLPPRAYTLAQNGAFAAEFGSNQPWGATLSIGIVLPSLPPGFDSTATVLRVSLGDQTQVITSPFSLQAVTFDRTALVTGRYALTVELWGGSSVLQRRHLGSQTYIIYLQGAPS